MNRTAPYLALSVVLWPLVAPGQSAGLDSGGQDERMRIEGQVEKSYTIELEAPRHREYCEARIWTEYLQKNTVVAVSGEIENADCGASGGEYTIAIRFRDEGGEVRTVEHVESWQRDDERNVRFESDYYMGENVDLIRVRARKIVCICAHTAEAAEANEGENR